METPPLHVLLALDAQILGGDVYDNTSPTPSVTAGDDLSTSSTTVHDDDDDEALLPSPARDGPATVANKGKGTTRTTTSRFWGVSWHKEMQRWQAKYKDANGKTRFIGRFDTEEAAAHAVNAAIRRAGLEGKRHTNPVVDGRLVPRVRTMKKKRRRDEPAASSSRGRRRR